MSVIDEYLQNVSSPQKEELERVRAIVQQTVPDAEEVISYGMPGFKYQKKYLVTFGAFKDHMSIFPGAWPTEAVKEQLSSFQTSKGTIQFTVEHPLPEALIKELVLLSVKKISGE